MDRRTMPYGSPRPRHASPVVVLDLDDVELVEETYRRAMTRAPQPVVRASQPRAHRYPPAMSDRELRRLVDECTEELCQLEYRTHYRSSRRALR